MKVKATNEFKKHNVKPQELENIPEEGKEFDVTKERFEILSGDNRFNVVFVEEVKEQPKKEETKKNKKEK